MATTERRTTTGFLLAAALVCLAGAGALVHQFAGRWESKPSTTVAGPALLVPLDGPNGRPLAPALPEPTQAFAYLTGAVRREGVYPVGANGRWSDVVDAAGGLLPDADGSAVNLAARVADGEHLHVPFRVDLKTPQSSSRATGTTGTVKTLRVNVNRATVDELAQLPGVGPIIAGRIVAWRTNRGAFSSPDDLARVSGIGPAKLAKMKPFLSF